MTKKIISAIILVLIFVPFIIVGELPFTIFMTVLSIFGLYELLKVRETEPGEETLFECCKLAREYSSANQPSKVGVIYTKRKFIKKPPKAPLGYVIYKNEKEVLV